MYRIYLLIVLCFISMSGYGSSADIWLLIDTGKLTLEVKQGQETIETFSGIAIGRGGAGFKEFRGDDITPLGTYKIGWVNRKSHYHRFYGFDYPSPENVERAFADGLISRSVYSKITKAHQHQAVPPQSTPLGGQIGIHGLGRGDIKIHKTMNWTHGCVALTNEQIDRLDRWIKKGTVVKLK